MSTAWIYQKGSDVERLGEDKASWYVGWYEPEGKRKGKSCGPGFHGKQKAIRLMAKVEAELMTGTYRSQQQKAWEEFRQDYESQILPGLAVRTREETTAALDHFERIAKPGRVASICTPTID